MYIRIGGYRAVWDDGKLLDNGIDLWTTVFNWPPKDLRCSHIEYWTPDIHGNFEYPDPEAKNGIRYVGLCWTSTMGQVGGRKGPGGVRCAPASEVVGKHPERWFYGQMWVPTATYKFVVNKMEYEVETNQGYDIPLVISFFWFWRIGSASKYICSEFVDMMVWLTCLVTPVRTAVMKLFIKVRKPAPSPVRLVLRLRKSGMLFFDLVTKRPLGQKGQKGQKG